MKRAQVTASDAKPALTPKRRFPEFRDSPGWKERPIREAISPVVREKPKPQVPYVGLGVRSHAKGTFIKANEDPRKNTMDVLYEVKRDDLIVNITFAWEGAIAIAKPEDEGALVSHRFPTYTFEREVAIPGFLQFVICTKRFAYDLGVISPGGAGRNRVLNKNDFLKLSTVLPGVDEQQKIAECLSTLDELIGATSQKLDALKAHKKGLMQQLFPREGETVPRLRFPAFSGAWDESPLEALSTSISSGRDEKLPDGPFDLYGSTGVIGKTSSETFVGTFLLVARVGANAGFLTKISGSFGVTDNTLVIDLTDKENSDFIYYYLGNLGLNKMIFGSGQPLITGGQLKALPVPLPCKSEREKISSCLSSLDELIIAQSNKLVALKDHKKGLMQQLFPHPAESAG